jgi:type IX secretion system PorP/SprF family membrane protein
MNNMIAQDLHFSLPNRTPMLLNPSLAGAFFGDYRVASAYKSQWSSISTPFQTLYGSYDMKLASSNENHMGFGLSFFNDKAGKTSMGSTQLTLCLAYEFQIQEKHYVAGGLQMGFVQRSAIFDNVKWDNQFDGVGYDPSLPSGENEFPQSHTYLDAGAGFNWKYVPDNKLTARIGVAMYHINMPNDSYILGGDDQLNFRSVMHASAMYILNKHYAVEPKLFFVHKGGAMEVTAGSLVRYVTGEHSLYTNATRPSSISMGCFYRYGDAVIASLLYDYHRSLSLGVNYDLNISSLRAVSSLRGGIEISLIFKGFYEKQHIKL